jgi:GNAT superfamily N-acetyltransferase
VPAAEPVLPEALPIRRLRAADLGSCGRLATDRGWPPEQNKWRLLLEISEAYGIDDPAGGLAGAIVLTRYGRALASVGMMLVASRYGRRGLGRRLLAHVLERSVPAVVYLAASSYSDRVCLDLGFRIIDTVDRHAGPFVPQPGAPARGRVRAASRSDLPALAALDLRIFGADRRPVLTRLFGFAERVLVAEDDHGSLAGFAGAWRNEDDLVVGPLVAADEAAARALIAAAAARADGPVRVDIRGCHPGLAGWATGRGLIPCGHATLMVRGGDLPGDRGQLFAPLSGATG